MIELTSISDSELTRLLAAVESGDLLAPFTAAALASSGFGEHAKNLPWIADLDRASLCAVLKVALAERRRAPIESVELVWTGPEGPGSSARDTAVVLRELFTSAEQRVLVAGFSFDHGEEILRPLFERMRDRGVATTIFMNVPRAVIGASAIKTARDAAERFLEDSWTFGAPLPELYYAPETVRSDSLSSIHAKCVVVDGARALVSSANFTDRGQTRNIEAGVRIVSPRFAFHLEAQWRRLISQGLMKNALAREA